MSLETLASHAVTETIYKRTHAKLAVNRLFEGRKIVAVQTGRSYAEKTFCLADPTLF